MSKFATSPPARNLDMSHVLDDACDTTAREAMLDTMPDDAMPDTMLDTMPDDAMLDTMPDDAMLDTMPDDAMLDTMPDTMLDTARDSMPDTARDAMLDTALPDDARDAILPDDAMLDTARDTPLPDVPLGAFLDAHIARVTANARDASHTADTIEIEPVFAPVRPSSPRYEMPVIPEGYIMEGDIAEDFLACKDAYDAEKLVLKWKEKSREVRMRNDPKFATSPIFVTDKDYEFSVHPEIISLVESDPFHGYESETVIAHLAKLSKIANLFTNEEKIRHYYILKLFPFSLKDDAKAWFTSCSPDVEQVLQAQNLLNELNDNSVRVITRGGKMTEEPLYPEGHPKRIDQDSQGTNADTPSHPKEKKDDRNLHASSPNTITPEEPNDISASDAETQSGDEHEPGDNVDSDVHNNAQPSHDEDVEIEPTVNPDNPQPKRYDKNDFTARKHGKEREPWVQSPMPFPPKPSKKKDDEDFERFVEMIRPIFLQMRLTDMLKMSPYAKYMKDIVTNKRKIPDLEISTMLANYTFKDLSWIS
ncbi:hypothetical protein ZWY2020_040618 [Hordeum vulgare]|nr:hypothetical protein ZWY2020_040618 [Hordeum vulgare]